jgi:hypothetical protein
LLRELILPCYPIPVNVPDRHREYLRPDMSLSDCWPQKKLEAAKFLDPICKKLCLFLKGHVVWFPINNLQWSVRITSSIYWFVVLDLVGTAEIQGIGQFPG